MNKNIIEMAAKDRNLITINIPSDIHFSYIHITDINIYLRKEELYINKIVLLLFDKIYLYEDIYIMCNFLYNNKENQLLGILRVKDNNSNENIMYTVTCYNSTKNLRLNGKNIYNNMCTNKKLYNLYFTNKKGELIAMPTDLLLLIYLNI
jgi:hypothetical protein